MSRHKRIQLSDEVLPDGFLVEVEGVPKYISYSLTSRLLPNTIRKPGYWIAILHEGENILPIRNSHDGLPFTQAEHDALLDASIRGEAVVFQGRICKTEDERPLLDVLAYKVGDVETTIFRK